MAICRILFNFCVVFCIISIWSSTVVNAVDNDHLGKFEYNLSSYLHIIIIIIITGESRNLSQGIP